MFCVPPEYFIKYFSEFSCNMVCVSHIYAKIVIAFSPDQLQIDWPFTTIDF